MSLGSEVQIRCKILEEIHKWGDYYQVEFDDDESIDLLESIFEGLRVGRAFDPCIPVTLSHEDEHYNNTTNKQNNGWGD